MQSKLDDCVCKKCGSCWPCPTAMKRHLIAHDTENIETSGDYAIWQDVEDELLTSDTDENITEEVLDDAMPIISDFKSNLKSPFEPLFRED